MQRELNPNRHLAVENRSPHEIHTRSDTNTKTKATQFTFIVAKLSATIVVDNAFYLSRKIIPSNATPQTSFVTDLSDNIGYRDEGIIPRTRIAIIDWIIRTSFSRLDFSLSSKREENPWMKRTRERKEAVKTKVDSLSKVDSNIMNGLLSRHASVPAYVPLWFFALISITLFPRTFHPFSEDFPVRPRSGFTTNLLARARGRMSH